MTMSGLHIYYYDDEERDELILALCVRVQDLEDFDAMDEDLVARKYLVARGLLAKMENDKAAEAARAQRVESYGGTT